MERRLMTIANAKLKSNFGKDCHIIHGIYCFFKILTKYRFKRTNFEISFIFYSWFALDFLKMDFDELHFWSISNLIFTVCVACKTQVWNRPKMEFVQIHFSEIKCGWTGSIFAFSFTGNLLLVCCVSTSNLLFKASIVYTFFFLFNKRWTCVKKLHFKLTTYYFWILINGWWIVKNNSRCSLNWNK